MSITIDFERNRHVRIDDATVEPQPPDAVSISVSGTLRLGEEVLASVAGTTLEPVRVAFAADGRRVEIDLREEASLRLDDVDVGLELPDPDGAVPEGLPSSGSEAVSDVVDAATDRPGVLAFTATGTIVETPPETVATLAEASNSSPKSVTFEPETPVRGDGGRTDPVLETTLFGFGVVVYRDGRISVGLRDSAVAP